MKQLFISHYSKHAEEVAILARELRFRGVRPWVDKQGGFLIGDQAADVAEQAIREDCLGFVLYATKDVFKRPFIREHELPQALAMRERDPRFLLVAVPRGMNFSTLKKLSKSAYRVDLSRFHTRPVLGDIKEIGPALAEIATDLADRILARSDLDSHDCITVQFSTRELAPVEETEVVTINGTEAYGDSACPDSFNQLTVGLRDLKKAIAARFGRPQLVVHGFKHLSAAFLFGRVFQPFDISVRQKTTEQWSLNRTPGSTAVMCSTSVPCETAEDLVVQVSSRFKELTPAVDRAMPGVAFSRLVLRPVEPPLNVDEGACAAMVRDCYAAIDQETSRQPVRRVHLFAAAPQAVLVGLGMRFAGMPETRVYDFDGSDYMAARTVPGGVL